MKTPMFKTWQLVLLVSGVAFVGVGLKVVGQTTSSTGRPDINAEATSVGTAVPVITAAASEPAPDVFLSATTNNSVPTDLKVSPDLAEIIKLAQAGLSEDVMMAYISNSVRVFNLGSDEIIYLNDLGVPSSVVTAMIQQDTSPESAARKLASNPPSPLPPGLALNSPASNVYPAQQTRAAQPEETAVEADIETPSATTYATTEYTPQPAAVSSFYNSLAPYGNWVAVNGYGLCWQPTVVRVNRSWQPYCDRGRWVYSDCGWYWLSDYSWGWAPFHYGRWVSNASYGWVWAPDCTWGPAWVSWRYSQNYCGWAPLPPEACFTAGIGFTFHHRPVGIDFEFGLRARHYNFIPFDRFCDYSPSRHRVSAAYVNNVYSQTKFVNRIRVLGNNNTVINEGFDPAHVAAVTRNEVRRVTVRDTSASIGKPAKYDHLEREGNKLVVFRPQLPTPTLAKPAATGGRARSENRDKLTAPIRNTATGPSGFSHNNTTVIRPSQRQNITASTSSTEVEKPRVFVTRSNGGLTIRGEPHRPQYSPVTVTASTQSDAQPSVALTRIERQQSRSIRTESPGPQALPARSQFNPSPPAYSQPNRVEQRNNSRSQFAQSESSLRPAPPAYSPQPSSPSVAPTRDNSSHSSGHQSSPNSDKGDRKR